VERRRMESGGNGEVEGLVWGEGSFGVWFGMWDVGCGMDSGRIVSEVYGTRFFTMF
jgi:hypothetical protein